MTQKFRCDCPFTSAIDILGDKWMLVIVKQMLLENKTTFKDFTESDEAIATNILSTKLNLLEELEINTKTHPPNNINSILFVLTELGLALTPLLVELAIWSDKHLREFHPEIQDGDGLKFIRSNKEGFINNIINSYRQKWTAIQ